MKNIKRLLVLATTGLLTTTAQAQLSGSLNLDYNSHFISYGLDVWGAGTDLDDFLFNPSLSVNYDVSDVFSLNAGIWLDVNDVPGVFTVQETDIWIGAAYDLGFGSISATYQSWQFGDVTGNDDNTEDIIDIGLSLNTVLSPSITIHNRVGEGASGGDTGTIIVLGISHGFDLSDQLSLGLSSSVSFNLTDDYFGVGGDTGFGFASLGASLSYALDDSTSIYAGVTYYITEEDVIGNPDDEFLTTNAGISFSF